MKPIIDKLKARAAVNNSKRLGSLAKATSEILNLARAAGYTGSDPEAALVHLERRSVAAVSVNAPLAKVSVSSAQPDRKAALWAEYNALPVAKRNSFYKQHRSEMSSAAPAVIVRSGRVAK